MYMMMRGCAGDPSDAAPVTGSVPVNDLECCATDRCVCALNLVLRQALVEFYCRNATTVAQKASYCSCSERTLYNRVYEAQRQIMGYLNDLSCGIPVPVWFAAGAEKNNTRPVDTVAGNIYISGKLV